MQRLESSPSSNDWEQAYVQLETYEQAMRKNWRRLKRCGLLEHLRPHMRVLDLCCGQGTILNRLALIGTQAVGLDCSWSLLRLAQQRGADHLVCADSSALPFRDDSFDFVIVQGGLHHLWVEQLEQTLTEVDRVLKAGGLFAFSEPANTWALRLYVRLVETPLSSLTSYTRNWRKTLDHERPTYFNWLQMQERALDLLGQRMELLRADRGLVTLFGLARSKKGSPNAIDHDRQ